MSTVFCLDHEQNVYDNTSGSQGDLMGTTNRTLNRDGSFNVYAVREREREWDLRDAYHGLLSMSWPRFFVMLIAVYLLLNCLFGLGYFLCGSEALEGVNRTNMSQHYLECFFFSVQTFATIGYGRISPVGVVANALVTLEAFSGLLSLSLATGLLFARFARPTANITFANFGVRYVHDGVPSLLFRIANNRDNQISQATIGANLLITEKTKEGETYRNFYDLTLDRNHTPVLSLTWTIVHQIDESSPLFGHTPDSLREANAEIMLSVTGTDDTFNQQVNARFSYTVDEILWNKRYVDILKRNADGCNVVELGKLHDVQDF